MTLSQPANGRAGEDDDSDLDEAEVGGAVDMNGHNDNDVRVMGYIMSCGGGILVSAQSSEKEGATNRNIVSRRRPGPSSEYKDRLGYFYFLGCLGLFGAVRGCLELI